MAEPTPDAPKSRTNLRDVLIAGFESDRGLPSEQNARRRGRLGRRTRAITSVRIGGAESFFVGVFGGMAGGLAAGYGLMMVAEIARSSVHDSIPILFTAPVAPSLYLIGAFVGAITGICLGCILFAPWIERRRYRGTRFGGRP